MLTEDIKTQIREAHERLVSCRGIRKRRAQNYLVAEAARVAAGCGQQALISVVEAPTGTGKSLGYLLGGIPAAQARKKKLVIATATVVLQQQLLENEIPRLRDVAGIDFTARLAKGRTRYVCDQRLAAADAANPDQDRLDFAEDELEPVWRERPSDVDLAAVAAMRSARAKNQWDGDLDRWASKLSPAVLSAVTASAAQCSGSVCPFYQRCAFRQARMGLKSADVIVANHALVLASLKCSAESSPLPAPEECVYVFDEAHHVPAAAVEAFSHVVDPRGLSMILQRARTASGQAARALELSPERIDLVGGHMEATRRQLLDLGPLLESILVNACRPAAGSQPTTVLLEEGAQRAVADCLQDVVQAAAPLREALEGLLAGLEAAADAGKVPPERMGELKVRIGPLVERVGDLLALIDAFLADDSVAPIARWIEAEPASAGRVRLHVAPVSAAHELRSALWDKAAGVLMTSATLRSLDRFDLYLEEAGLQGMASTQALPSPFALEEQATLHVVGGPATTQRLDLHTDEVVETIVRAHARQAGTLVLFSSHRQMRDVAVRLPPDIGAYTLLQGQFGREELLRRHGERVEAGLPSVLMGVQGLSEGLDLPGPLCEVVVIAKLPFAPPDGPVQLALERHMKSQGRSFFDEVVVPKAHLRLIQSCGRLIRTETDSGAIYIVDSRLRTTRYGRRMLSTLPPYRRAAEVG